MSKKKPTKAAQRARLRELKTYLADKHSRDRKGFDAYEKAHFAGKAGKISAAEAKRLKDKHRMPHRRYWAAYEEHRLLAKELAK